LGTPLGNTMGTYWEPDGNPLATWREQRKNEKKSSPPPTQNLKRKKIKAPWVHASAYPLAACIFGNPWEHLGKHIRNLGNMWIMPLGTCEEHSENMVGNTKIQKNQTPRRLRSSDRGISWPKIYINRSRPSAEDTESLVGLPCDVCYIPCGNSKPPACNLLSIKYPKLGVIGAQFWKKNWALNFLKRVRIDNSIQGGKKKRRPNWLVSSHLNWSSQEFHTQFCILPHMHLLHSLSAHTLS
jgi:hypothetical protein